MIARPRRTGFTLLEVLLVMAILVIMGAVSLPSMMAMYGDSRVRGAADEIRGAWGEARARAINTGVAYKFAVMKGKERYRIAPDTTEGWDGSKSSGSDGDSDDGTEKTGSLPKGILFHPGDGETEEAGGWLSLVSFLPDGTCKILPILTDGTTKKDKEITLSQEGGGYEMVVSVRALTGIVSVKTKKQMERE